MSGSRKAEEIYNKLRGQSRGSGSIGRTFPAARFLSYYLKEMPRISAWAKEHGLIEFSILRLRPVLSADFKKRLGAMVGEHLVPAHPHAAKILENGWRWRILSIREYNLMVYYADFSRKAMLVVNAAQLARNDFYRMTEAYFRVVYSAGQVKTLVAVFKKVFALAGDGVGGDPEALERVARNLECFFDAECLRPSFNDMILAHTMVAFRRALSWSDLTRPNLTLPVQEKYYECSLAVFERLLAHLQGVLKEIETLRTERQGIAWILATIGEDGVEGAERLMAFYEEMGRSWHGDSGDVFLIMLTVLQGLVKKLREICDDKWQVMTGEEKIVNMKIVTDTVLREKVESVAVLHETANERHKLMSPQEISLFRYRDALDPVALCATENQKFVHGTVLIALGSLYAAASTLKDIAEGRRGGYPPEFYSTHMVVNKARWKGRPVSEVFDHYIRLILQTCAFFRIREVQRDAAQMERIEKGLEAREREKAALDATGLISQHLGSAKGR
jgi:hypothetical protein